MRLRRKFPGPKTDSQRDYQQQLGKAAVGASTGCAIDSDRPAPGWDTRLIYTGQLITPLYGGGVKPGEVDPLMPLRAKALRGHLRFWWRLLALRGALAAVGGPGPVSGAELFRLERQRWGGMSTPDTDNSSQIRVQVAIAQHPTAWNRIPFDYWNRADRKWQTSDPYKGLEYALFSAKHEQGVLPKELTPPSPEARFRVIFDIAKHKRAPATLPAELELTMRWWASFGGFGSRTRRGMGAVLVRDASGGVLQITRDDLDRVPCVLKIRPERFTDAVRALRTAVGRICDFRQGGKVGRTKKFGSSEWPEPNNIRGLANTHLVLPATARNGPKKHEPQPTAACGYFPRAAFGLPITFKFVDDEETVLSKGQGHKSFGATKFDPPKSDLKPRESSRMASPLIVKAMYVGENESGMCEYAPAALLLPTAGDVYAKPLILEHKWTGGQPQPIPINDWWPAGNPDRAAATAAIAPMQKADHGGGIADPLHAFLHYFMAK